MAKVNTSASGALRRDRDRDAAAIMKRPAFQNLVRERSRFAWFMSALMLGVYLLFILLVAFAHDVMATKIGGGEISLGILLGLGVIIFAFVLTGVYVRRANGRYDDLTRDVIAGQTS